MCTIEIENGREPPRKPSFFYNKTTGKPGDVCLVSM